MTEEQVAAVPQAAVQALHQGLRRLACEVDRHVAAEHQVDAFAGEGHRLGHEVVAADLDQLAHLRADLVAAVRGRGEEPCTLLRRGQLDGPLAVTAGPRRLDGTGGDVGGHDLHVPALRRRHQLRRGSWRCCTAPHPSSSRRSRSAAAGRSARRAGADRAARGRAALSPAAGSGRSASPGSSPRRAAAGAPSVPRATAGTTRRRAPRSRAAARRRRTPGTACGCRRRPGRRPGPAAHAGVELRAGQGRVHSRPTSPRTAAAISPTGSWRSTAPSTNAACGMP